MTRDPKRAKFDFFRQSIAAAGLSTEDDNSLICPLCWQETPYEELSLEHMVPGSVGGKQRTLTCRKCNNDHGRDLDSHLTQYQRVKDAFNGHGTLKTKLNVNGHEMVANLEWGDGSKNFHVVGKATNPAASDGSQEEFKAGNVEKVKFTLYFDYNSNNFKTAVLRAAYLVLFKCFGYEYAKHEIVQTVRRRIAGRQLGHPDLATLILELRDFIPPHDDQHFVVPGNVNGVEFFLVIIRIRCETTTYLGAYMPVPVDRCDEFFDLMELAAKEHNGETLAIPTAAMFG
jgi:hypothetical protein